METTSIITAKESPFVLLREAMEAKRRIYDKYPQSLSNAVQEQIKSLNELIRELTEEMEKLENKVYTHD